MKKVILAGLTFAPVLAFAQTLNNVNTLVISIGKLVKLTLPVVVGIALLVFFWGLVKFIFAQGSETVKTEAKKVMIWGLVALFVMVSVWGIVRFMQEALLDGTDFSTPPIPTI